MGDHLRFISLYPQEAQVPDHRSTAQGSLIVTCEGPAPKKVRSSVSFLSILVVIKPLPSACSEQGTGDTEEEALCLRESRMAGSKGSTHK